MSEAEGVSGSGPLQVRPTWGGSRPGSVAGWGALGAVGSWWRARPDRPSRAASTMRASRPDSPLMQAGRLTWACLNLYGGQNVPPMGLPSPLPVRGPHYNSLERRRRSLTRLQQCVNMRATHKCYVFPCLLRKSRKHGPGRERPPSARAMTTGAG
jgi:hypothetical protein